jgi:chemotaxis protein histidine kinase CheA
VPQPGGDVLQRLDAANRALESERDALRAEKRAIEQQLLDAQRQQPSAADPTPQINALRAELKALQQRTQQREAEAALSERRLRAAQQAADNAAAEVRRLREQALLPPAPSHNPEPQEPSQPAEPAIETETRIDTTSLSSSWVSVMKSLAVGAVTLAAPQFAIPLTAGLGAAGWLWSKRKQRLAKAQPAPRPQLGSNQNPITFFEPSATKIETKYVVTESDVLGEAYKEAVRRVGNSHRERMPGIVDVLKQVDAAAQHIAHGARVVRRPSSEPQSESLPS